MLFSQYVLAISGAVSSAGARTGETLTSVARFIAYIIDRLPNWITSIVIFVAAFALARLAKSVVMNRVADKVDEEHQEMTALAGRATYGLVLVIGITISLSIAGIDLTAMLAAVGFGLSFAMQDLIMNFVAGVMILMARQFSIGDFIQVGGTMGTIEDIQSRFTRLKTLDGTRVIVPNKDLFSNQVISYTSNVFRRIDVPLGISYSGSLSQAAQVALEVIKANPNILQQPPAAIVIDSFGRSSINIILRFWVESKSNWIQTKSELIAAVKQAFDSAGIVIPFPQRTIHMESDDKEKQIYQGIQQSSSADYEHPKPVDVGVPVAVAETASGQEVQIPASPAAVPMETSDPVATQTQQANSGEIDETGSDFLKTDS